MIQVQSFTTDVLLTHKMFFILDKLPKNSTEVDVWIQTPAGNESVDFIDAFLLADGTLLAAWVHPFEKLPLHNLTVFCNGVTQVLNLYPLERIIDIYDRPIDSELGTFIFTKSIPVIGGDWRCDRGMYGGGSFVEENVERVISELNQIVVYEPFVNLNGVAHIMYLEATGRTQLAEEKINNSIAPVTGRTLQETMRLIYEWSVLAQDPFNSTDEAALAAKTFLNLLDFTVEERVALSSLPPMQISNYLAGSETARVRPSNIPELDETIKTMVFKRMASSSLSALFKIHDIEDTYGLTELEQAELEAGIQRFKDYYQIPEDWNITDTTKIIEHCELLFNSTYGPYVYNQLRLFKNKQFILNNVQNNLF